MMSVPVAQVRLGNRLRWHGECEQLWGGSVGRCAAYACHANSRNRLSVDLYVFRPLRVRYMGVAWSQGLILGVLEPSHRCSFTW